MKLTSSTLAILQLFSLIAWAKQPQYQILPPLREQAALQDEWTAQRKALVPSLLTKYGVDAWLVRLFIHKSTLTFSCS